MDPGLFMLHNCDDDNGNDVIDKNEIAEVNGEDDLIVIDLSICRGSDANGNLHTGNVTIKRTNSKIKLYKPTNGNKKDIVILGDNNSKTYTIEDFEDDLEGAFFIEGCELGESEIEIIFHGVSDKAKITVSGLIINKVTSLQDTPQSDFNNSDNVREKKRNLYLCANEDGEIKIQIELSEGPYNNNAYIGLLEHDEVFYSKSIVDYGVCFDFGDDVPIYDVVLGDDNNANGLLDYDEIISTFPIELNLISRFDYDLSFDCLSLAQMELGIGGDLLGCFLLKDEIPIEATWPISSSEIYYNNSSLTHPVGAIWDSSGKAQVRHFTFSKDTNVAKDVAKDSGLVDNMITYTLHQHNNEIIEYFNNNPNKNEHVFDSWNCQTESGKKLITFDNFSLKSAFGHVIPNVSLTIKAIKNDSSITISEIWYNGNFTDIYDYDYLGMLPSIHGARIQLGYNIKNNYAGEIFKSTVYFEKHLTDYNYTLN